MDIIDCFGDICPIPVLKIAKKLKSINKGDEFMVVTDHSCTLESIRDQYSAQVVKIDEVMNGVWEVTFKK